ncbi:MAG: SURF1 family protein [Pseudomonadota bacterium]
MTAAGRRGPQPRSRAGLVALGLVAASIFAGLIALGVWQVQRRAWKLDLIAQVEQRIHAPAVAVPGPDQWSGLTASTHAYRRVRVRGVYLDRRESFVQATTVLGGGYWVMTPLRTDRGFIVLINRGFVPPEQRRVKNQPTRGDTAPVTVTGLLRMSEPGGGFLRANDPRAARWYSRDVAAIAAAHGLHDVAPYFIDADAGAAGAAAGGAAGGDRGGPVGGLTIIAFPNNHAVYALTWFALAAMVAAGAAYAIRSEWRNRRDGDREGA